ncbi:MAG: primase alpha helix C-terminal domain-containing protein [Sulfuricurvum sp.]|uniref:primase alpha helix C-terminal domain-containing protein n=1 Tax=Sulfuricurvum sp. TaxID=2025608 RepID=UPI002735B8F3|nr:primase alpha helix C-terminal domain-containing protein [Sulfuricurvum sp.]MDP2851572.1 primase alpha helix C-terminal domain-containing protein [Sulfuricurvum sp.]
MKTNEGDLFALLLKNLPPKIHCSDNKSGAYSKPLEMTHNALKSSLFIEFNSKERTTIVVFDKDTHEGQTALEYFGDLVIFEEWLLEMIEIRPSYICATTKGFQFGFFIKGFLNVQAGHNPKNSPQYFLSDIKSRYIRYLDLDKIASSKNHGIFRNPLRHKHIAYTSVIYDLKDLKGALPLEAFASEIFSYSSKSYLSVSKHQKISSNRNCTIFKLCCREFAYSKATKQHIFSFAKRLNDEKCYEPLPINEIRSITNSIYKLSQNATLRSGSKKAQINRAKLVKDRKKQIIKYFLKCKEENRNPIKAELARNLSISVTSLNSTYGDFIKLRWQK